MHTIIHNKEAAEKALSLCRGVYQRNIVLGNEALSGATLHGKAKTYAGKYKLSAQRLILRLNENGIPAYETVGRKNKRILNIG